MTLYYRRHLDDREVHRRWIDPRLNSIRVSQLRAYLLEKRWKEVPPDRPDVVVFEEPTASAEGPLYQWFPDPEDRRDYRQAVYELLAALGEIEDRYAGDILTDILERTAAGGQSANGPGMTTGTEPARK